MYLPIIKKIPSFLRVSGHGFDMSRVMLSNFHFEIHTSSANMDDILLYPLENYNSRSPKLILKNYLLLIFNLSPLKNKFFSHNLILAKHIVLMMTKEECSCLNLKSKIWTRSCTLRTSRSLLSIS